MKLKISRKEAIEKIEDFFRQEELDKESVKKIKRIAMKYNIKLGKYRRRFCKECLEDLKKGKIRISSGYKTIECKSCGYKNRFKLS